MAFPTKPCRYCGSRGHWPYACYQNPNRKAVRHVGKYTKRWFQTRKQWIKENPPDEHGFWKCYLMIAPNCQRYLTEDSLTLDHVKSRSRHPELRFEKENLQPACKPCNKLKGSRDLEMVKSVQG